VFHWRKDAKAVEVNEAISLPEYHLKNVTAIVCSQNINSTGRPTVIQSFFSFCSFEHQVGHMTPEKN